MVQVITPSERLRRLRSLRVELDAEIAAEEQRIERAALVRQVPRQRPAARPQPFVFTGDPFAATSRDVRAWALSVGIALGERGRVPARVRAAFIDAHTVKV